MRFGPHEVARAKTLKAIGFPWRPKLGDWYVSHSGFCEMVRDFAEVGAVGRNGHAFLPVWSDCRDWLQDRGWRHPEVVLDEPGHVMMTLTHDDGRLLRSTGVSDLDCLYRMIMMLLLGSRRA